MNLISSQEIKKVVCPHCGGRECKEVDEGICQCLKCEKKFDESEVFDGSENGIGN